MTEQRALVLGGNGPQRAECYRCHSLLAMRGATVRRADGLVPRPGRESRTGLPRYGPPRRRGHKDPRQAGDLAVNAVTRDIGNPGALYVNCPSCDRGQVVRWLPVL